MLLFERSRRMGSIHCSGNRVRNRGTLRGELARVALLQIASRKGCLFVHHGFMVRLLVFGIEAIDGVLPIVYTTPCQLLSVCRECFTTPYMCVLCTDCRV